MKKFRLVVEIVCYLSSRSESEQFADTSDSGAIATTSVSAAETTSVSAAETTSVSADVIGIKESDSDVTGSDSGSRRRLVHKSAGKERPASRILVRSVHQSSTDKTVDTETVTDGTENENENQSNVSTGIRKPSPSVSEMLYGENVRKDSLENVLLEPRSSVDLAAGLSSDTSDMSERRRFVRRGEDNSPRIPLSDSDQSVSSALSENSKKRRKDKSSMRKSKLNEGSSCEGKILLII